MFYSKVSHMHYNETRYLFPLKSGTRQGGFPSGHATEELICSTKKLEVRVQVSQDDFNFFNEHLCVLANYFISYYQK